NGAYYRFHQKNPSDLLGESFMTYLLPEDQVILKEKLADLSQANPTFTIEHLTLMPDGQSPWVEWVNRAFFDAEGNITEIQSVGRDITQRRQHEELLESALARETELHRLKSQF